MIPYDIALGLAALLAAGLGLAWFLWQRRLVAWRRAAAGATEPLGAAPGGYLVFPADGSGERAAPSFLAATGGAAHGLAEFLALLRPDDRPPLERAVAALRTRGEAFALVAATADGARLFQIDGARADAADYLWVRDLSPASDRAAARAPEAVRIRAERDALARLADALPIPAWRRDGAGKLVYVNRAYARAVEATPETTIAEGRELAPRPAPGAPQTAGRHLVIGGERRRLLVSEAEDDGGTLGFALDTTESEHAADELQRHMAAHADVLENLAVAISIYGADTRLRFHNSAYAKLWGHDAAWLASGPSYAEELALLQERRRLPESADFRKYVQQEVAQFTNVVLPTEALLHLPDGTALRRRVAPHPMGGLLFTFENVTDRFALERSYNTLIAVQRRTLDHLYEGVALIGADGRLQLCNPAYARLWQLQPADLEGQPHIADVVERCRPLYRDTGDWAEEKERIIARITGREAKSDRLQRGDGSVLEYAIEPLPDGAVLLSYADITDRFKVEQALRERTEALEAADRLKAEFIANVSYELRNPLNSIMGFAEMLRLGQFGRLTAKQRGYVDNIVAASEALMALINDILDLASIEAGYMELVPARFDVHALMAGVFALTREQARRQHLTPLFDCPADIGEMTADERRLKQVLFNLVSNAVKFTPSGGTITLAATREGGDYVFSVSDTGIGIPEGEQRRMLDPFERGTQRAVRQTGAGAGLGLSLVKRIVELHGGRVEIVSRPDHGTRVACRVPAEPPLAAAAQ